MYNCLYIWGCSVAQLCLALRYPMDCSTPVLLSFTVSWKGLLKLRSIGSVMLPSHLILCCPLLLPSVFPSIRVFSNESALHIRWPKYWSFNFSISPSNEYSRLISFRIESIVILPISDSTVEFFLASPNKCFIFVFLISLLWKYRYVFLSRIP